MALESGGGISVLYTHKCGSPIQAAKIVRNDNNKFRYRLGRIFSNFLPSSSSSVKVHDPFWSIVVLGTTCMYKEIHNKERVTDKSIKAVLYIASVE